MALTQVIVINIQINVLDTVSVNIFIYLLFFFRASDYLSNVQYHNCCYLQFNHSCMVTSTPYCDLIANEFLYLIILSYSVQADIIVWDYPSRQQLYKLKLHKVKVEALAFSPNNYYLASLGGCDDGR